MFVFADMLQRISSIEDLSTPAFSKSNPNLEINHMLEAPNPSYVKLPIPLRSMQKFFLVTLTKEGIVMVSQHFVSA